MKVTLFKNTPKSWKADFFVDNQKYVFEGKQRPLDWEIMFYAAIDHKKVYKRVKTKKPLLVFKLVEKAFSLFIKDKKPIVIMFSARKKDLPRVNLYKVLGRKASKKYNYRHLDEDVSNQDEICFYHINY